MYTYSLNKVIRKRLKTLEDLVWNLKSCEGSEDIINDLEFLIQFIKRKTE